MTVTVSTPDEGTTGSRDGDSGTTLARTPAPLPDPDAGRFLRFIRLTGVAEVRHGEVSFPPGILWPYTSDLRRVRAAYDASDELPTSALLAAIATLHERVVFAPGRTGRDVADAYEEVKYGLRLRGSDTKP